MKDKIKFIIKSKRIYYFIFFTVLIYILLLFYADFSDILLALRKINLKYMPLIILFTLIAHCMMFLRWRYLLKNLKINPPLKQNIQIYFSSWAMFFAPAKSGELVKCFFLKKIYQIPYKKSAPVIFIEQITDLIIILLFSFLGVSLFNIISLDKIIPLFLFLFILIITFLLLLSYKKFVKKITTLTKKISFIKKYVIEFEHMYSTANNLIKPKILVVSLLFSLGFWFFISQILYVLLKAFNIKLMALIPASIFALSTLIGTLSFIPSGIGVMEASTLAILTSQGIDNSIATISLIIMRLFSLWFGAIIGILTLWNLNKKL